MRNWNKTAEYVINADCNKEDIATTGPNHLGKAKLLPVTY